MQSDKEQLHVLCNSKTTTEAIYCINIDVHRPVVVFQSLGRLRNETHGMHISSKYHPRNEIEVEVDFRC
jgi:hypothetical protein